MNKTVNIIGAGLAGLSAAIALAKNNIRSNLVSALPSERSQSVLAEGGINGALNTMGEADDPSYHFEDTIRAGVYIADEEAVRGLTENAPLILKELKKLGVPFNLKEEQIQQRNFGGQKKKRTAYAKSSTGKVLMTALIDEARKYETAGLINRYARHVLTDLVIDADQRCLGAVIKDLYSEEMMVLEGPVILCCGGMNGMFPEQTTGTVTNSGNAAALCLWKGVRFSNLEMIQYHPTTIKISGKRCLVSEAARGEGGRLFILRGGEPRYFMEELHPELGNLSPRDVVAREMYLTGVQVFLDMRHLDREIWEKRLPDLREEIVHYLGIDPAKEPVPVEPGIHYFMGGIDVDAKHRTNIKDLYAAGECCSQYHGANRLGGNSTMGAIYGGRTAASTVISTFADVQHNCCSERPDAPDVNEQIRDSSQDPVLAAKIRDLLMGALGIVRNGTSMEEALAEIRDLGHMEAAGAGKEETVNTDAQPAQECLCKTEEQKKVGQLQPCSAQYSVDKARLLLAQAMLESALIRKESRGAHFRSDYPETSERYRGRTVCEYDPDSGELKLSMACSE